MLCNLRNRHNEKGSIAIEFALIAPALLVLMFGMMEFGRAMWSLTTMQFAVERTVRYVLMNPDLDEESITTYAEESVFGLSITDITFTITEEADAAGDHLSIVATKPFAPFTGFLPIDNLTLTAKARFPMPDE